MDFKNKKVMFITTTDNMIWQFLIPHVKYLQDQGAIVDCICSKTGFWFDELKNKFGFNCIDLKMERNPINRTNLKAYKELKKLQKQNNYDIIYCQQPVGGLLGRLIGKKYKKPVIYIVHGFFFHKNNSKLKNILFKAAEKYLAKYTTCLITMNSEDFNAIKNWKVKYKYNISGIGFDPNKYDTQNVDKAKFKSELGIDKSKKIILSVSEFIKRKNYPTMLRTIKQLQDNGEKFKYLICGTGKLEQEMKQLAQSLGLEETVLFLGYRKDINAIMQISDVFFHESFQEGLTMSIMEAMYYGLPVVTSNVRGNQDLIDNKLGGYTTDCLDTNEQEKSLSAILNNKELSKSMGEYNKNKVKKYMLNNVMKELADIYNQI